MKIRTKIFLTFFLAGLALTIIGVSSFYYYFAESMKAQIFNNLDAVSRAEASHVQYFLSEHEKIVSMASEGLIFRDLLVLDESHSDYQEGIRRATKRLQDIIKNRPEVDEICILDAKGITIATNEEECANADRSADESFIEGRKAPFIKDVYLSDEGIPLLNISAPIEENGEFLGVIVFKTNLEELFEITTYTAGLGETGEVYIIDQNGYMITPSRFVEDSILKQRVDTVSTKNCLSMKANPTEHIGHDPVSVFSDYRGINVLGSHAYIPEMDWCLLAEIDIDEGLAPVNRMLMVAVAIGIIILIVVFIVANYIGGSISRPVIELQKGARIIEKGNLNYQVSTDSKDEIGDLSRAFDEMTVAIKKSRQEVDKKVEEQTKEIRAGNKQLKAQRGAILNILEDVQIEKEKVSKERDKISTILYSIGDGVFVVDNNFNIIIFNQAAVNMSGFTEKEAIGKRYDKILNFVSEKTNERNDRFIKETMATGKVGGMIDGILLTRKDGSKVPVADSAAPLKNKQGEVIGCVVVFRDVTEERKIDKAKSEFVSLASHQLRTPLTAISWFTELILKEDIGKLNKKQRQYLREVYIGNKRMIALVAALLNVSRIELGTLAIVPKPTDFVNVVQIAIKELASQVKEKKLKMETDFAEDLPDIDADPNLVKVVFQNILSNAIKYTPEKGRIEVELKKEKDDILFRVKDSGYGIPKNQQSKIFTKLFRADNAVEKEPDGTGLGLYIVKEVVEQSGGRVWFESEENKGTTFYVTIPLKGMRARKGTKGLTAV